MEINRVRWASRRGMLELDLVLEPFVEKHYLALPARQQASFCKLLESEDQDLYRWFMRQADPIDNNLLEIVELVRANTGLQPED